MNLLAVVVGIVLVVIVGAGAWVRLATIDPARYDVAGLTKSPGDHPATGGFQAARRLPDPAVEMQALDRIIRATARTEHVSGSVAAGHAAYVTRSALWGFPDVTQLWIAGDTLQIRGHLVYGRSDMGVNAARIKRWLDEAGI